MLGLTLCMTREKPKFHSENAQSERVKGIEPSYSAWKAAALPLSYTREFQKWGLQDSNLCRHSQWIYSPPPLTTRANPLLNLCARNAGGVLSSSTRYGLVSIKEPAEGLEPTTC